MSLSSLCLLLPLLFAAPTSTAPSVSLDCLGNLTGFSAPIDERNSVDVFFGIPYAQHVTEELRFEKPRPVKAWNGTLNATVFPKSCYSHATPDWIDELMGQIEGAEDDCLYLNIYTPSQRENAVHVAAPTKKALLPVLVLIHGGAYVGGGAGEYRNYTDIGLNFVRHGIVVVVLQYRLGEYGFASTGDAEMPGNLGLWDQTQALKFLRTHIARFGGDPNSVTLLGQSAGSASVSALGLSPRSRDLFHRAIQMSGSSLASWASAEDNADDTRTLAAAFNCPMGDSLSLKQCLRRQEPTQVLAKVTELNEPRVSRVNFNPRFDGDYLGEKDAFFPRDQLDLIKDKRTPRKPTLQGFTQLEALVFSFLIERNSSWAASAVNWTDARTWDQGRLENYIRRGVATTKRFGAESPNATADILDFYVNGDAGQRAAQMGYNGSVFYVRQYIQIFGDTFFAMPAMLEIQEKASAGWPVYMYINSHYNAPTFPTRAQGYPGIQETFHLHDLNFIFRDSSTNYSAFDAADHRVQQFLHESYRNFIKSGNPSTGSVEWPRVPSAQCLRHVHIVNGTAAVVEGSPLGESRRSRFWERITRKYPQYNVLRNAPGK